MEPLELNTFPYLTILNDVRFFPEMALPSTNIFSAHNFVAPKNIDWIYCFVCR